MQSQCTEFVLSSRRHKQFHLFDRTGHDVLRLLAACYSDETGRWVVAASGPQCCKACRLHAAK